MTSQNPRYAREFLEPFLGKKVVIGTSDFHYVSGRAVAFIDGTKLTVLINEKEIMIPVANVETISEVPEIQADYIK